MRISTQTGAMVVSDVAVMALTDDGRERSWVYDTGWVVAHAGPSAIWIGRQAVVYHVGDADLDDPSAA